MDQAIIMMAYEKFNDYELEENIEELKNLAYACEIDTMDVLVQNLKRKSNATYIGSGKVEELKYALEAQEANLVVFNVGLSP
ncbi:MAG TPA: GTPase HflX, partial [Erysipelothrix sp.]|nr:GTPase HflX [Erysipelothrix sp.]